MWERTVFKGRIIKVQYVEYMNALQIWYFNLNLTSDRERETGWRRFRHTTKRGTYESQVRLKKEFYAIVIWLLQRRLLQRRRHYYTQDALPTTRTCCFTSYDKSSTNFTVAQDGRFMTPVYVIRARLFVHACSMTRCTRQALPTAIFLMFIFSLSPVAEERVTRTVRKKAVLI